MTHRVELAPPVCVVHVDLPPQIESMAGVDLDVSGRLVKVTGPEVLGVPLSFEARLPAAVDPDSSRAKFSRKKHTLTVTINLVGGA